jgi:hypothetical protein
MNIQALFNPDIGDARTVNWGEIDHDQSKLPVAST